MEKMQLKRLSTEKPTVAPLEAKEVAALCEKRGLEYSEGDEGDVLRFAVSTEAQDIAGDVIKQDGWDLSEYDRNPVVLFQHNRSAPPLGVTLRTLPGVVRGAKALLADALYFKDPDFTLPQTVLRMAKKGILRGASVGFFPKRGSAKFVEDEKELATHGMSKPGRVFGQNILREWSNVTIPANADALRLALGGHIEGVSKSAAARVFDLRDEDMRTQPPVKALSYAPAAADPIEAAWLSLALRDAVEAPLDPLNARTKAYLLSRGVACGATAGEVLEILGESAPEEPVQDSAGWLTPEALKALVEESVQKTFKGLSLESATAPEPGEDGVDEAEAKAAAELYDMLV